MREATSVKIAKIIAMTVLLSSMIIGSFMLGSVYLQARASCDQMQALDSMLEKELMLETLQQVNDHQREIDVSILNVLARTFTQFGFKILPRICS